MFAPRSQSEIPKNLIFLYLRKITGFLAKFSFAPDFLQICATLQSSARMMLPYCLQAFRSWIRDSENAIQNFL